MAEHARRRERGAAATPFFREDGHALGDEALEFARWFVRSKYSLMASFLGELTRAPAERDGEALRARYCTAVRHAERVQRARGVVTFLLAMGVVAAAATSIAAFVDLPAERATIDLLERVAAIAASATVVLVALRLLFDRYLERVDVSATFLAMQLATATRASRP